MNNFKKIIQKPMGQVLLATLLFCFIFLALFVGLYKAGTAYILKEKSRRATNLTALTGGAVYANGLQLVRSSNKLLMVLIGIDLWKDGMAAATAFEGGPPAMLEAAYQADKVNSRTAFQNFQKYFFGIDSIGVYPGLIAAQAASTADENQLSSSPLYAYNYETSPTVLQTATPNMALRFRTASEFIPDSNESLYSLTHDGIKHYFSSDEVEPAENPRHPHQMRVKKGGFPESPYAGWWVKKESEGDDTPGKNPLSKIDQKYLAPLKEFLKKFKMDVTDRDYPPCHTFTLLGTLEGKIGSDEKTFYQVGEARIDSNGLAAWDLYPFDIYLENVDLTTFSILRDTLQTLNNIPELGQIIRSSDLVNGL
jgi:hypothetical protein